MPRSSTAAERQHLGSANIDFNLTGDLTTAGDATL